MAFQGKKLINNPDDVVTEFIEGLVETYPGLQYLDGFPQIKVVLRADVERGAYDKVAVISGGGSGHEPAHAGFVGPGMLTAAVSGDVFASPPVDSILAAIRAVTGPMGCLLIVKNYTGDRLNFGLAAEQAKSEGYKMEMVIVGDDCALPPPRGIAGRRGLAGTILVHKVAGAAADAGLSLADVAAEAKHASEVVGTMGVALSVCTLPGQVTSDRLGPKQMELGLGIHGEPGVAVVDLQPVDVVVEHVLKQILSQETQYLPITRGSNAVLLINGLGATPIMELMIAARKAVPELQLEYGIAVDRVYTGTLMTSLDMAGLSITIMKSDENILKRLDAPTKAPAWPVGSEGNRPPAKFPVPVPPSPSMKDDENYTGDRLNFGLAAEEAKSEGYKVEMVIIGDDCALPPTQGIAGRRGLAGTILVNKVAGAAADAGLPVEEVAEQARHAAKLVGTVGVALSVCTLPGQEISNRLGPEQIELGLGIHGEPGIAVTEHQCVDVVVARVLKQILSPETRYVPITRGDRVILLTNGLGATPIMELMIATRKAVRELQLEYGLTTDRVYTGSFMTSLDMQGFSISIMKSDTTILQCLDASTKAPCWPAGTDGDRQKPAKLAVPAPPSCAMKSDKMLQQSRELTKEGCILEASIEAGAKEIIRIKDSLNEWDSKVGDGDCGTTMYRGAIAILDDMKKCYPMNDAAETVNEIGASVRRVMGGTSGILYDILCKAAYANLKGIKTVEAKHWANALQASICAISKYGGARVGYRTMLDALIPASEILRERLEVGDDPLDAFVVSSEAAMTGAESTRHMQAQAGRSSYIAADKLASAPDPGAMAAAAWYRAVALSLKSTLCHSKP